MKKIKQFIPILTIGTAFFVIAIVCWIHKSSDFSLSERRKLAKMPSFSMATVLNGSFMKDFETYAQDQFPTREFNRKAAAFCSCSILRRTDNHDIYLVNGALGKLDYPLNEASIDYAGGRFKDIYDKYLAGAGCNIYLSVIPDKGYFLTKDNNYPHVDYEKLKVLMAEKMPYASLIDIYDCLDADCYYETDPHWRQEKLQAAAGKIAGGMGVTLKEVYDIRELPVEYKGTYAGQSALMTKPETINYIHNSMLEKCIMNNLENNTTGSIYDYDKGAGRDPYEFFMSGPVSLIKVSNPENKSGNKLIVFRDSFGSSIAPYLLEGYSEVDLVDIRYMPSAYLGNFVEFENADVLFLYCTSVLNHSETIK